MARTFSFSLWRVRRVFFSLSGDIFVDITGRAAEAATSQHDILFNWSVKGLNVEYIDAITEWENLENIWGKTCKLKPILPHQTKKTEDKKTTQQTNICSLSISKHTMFSISIARLLIDYHALANLLQSKSKVQESPIIFLNRSMRINEINICIHLIRFERNCTSSVCVTIKQLTQYAVSWLGSSDLNVIITILNHSHASFLAVIVHDSDSTSVEYVQEYMNACRCLCQCVCMCIYFKPHSSCAVCVLVSPK